MSEDTRESTRGNARGNARDDTRDDTRSEVYGELAAVGPYGVRPGHALITMVEPHPGHEYAYNRWYEDDHYYAGAMAMPWMYAGRRWVAPRELQLLRYPEKSAVAQPVTAGCYLSTYWVTEGRYDDHMKWTVGINKRLNRDGRVYQDRTHVFTAFQDHEATVYRDGAAGPRDFHALDHPYQGLVLEVIDAESGGQREELIEWLRAKQLPRALAGSPAAMVTIFRPTPLPGDRMTYVKQVEGVDTRLTLLWFLQADPRECWQEHFAGRADAVAESGLGRVELVAPFIPTVPGTDMYVDQLR
ncbi:hypothetical protein ACFQ7F_06865 [Streptomyces sp. NPDC056486]|uniref:hypothetical protein n=1 Tax=Streptomyces sp. NPDC056486 TaxID=3345835 RepID=UPI0036C6CC74